jgi:hypothetical protein
LFSSYVCNCIIMSVLVDSVASNKSLDDPTLRSDLDGSVGSNDGDRMRGSSHKLKVKHFITS